jgi:hypothetical protein
MIKSILDHGRLLLAATVAAGLFEFENLVLWARSEKIGYAVNQGRGMMEYWSAGMLGLAD